MTESPLPDLAAILRPILERVPPGQRPLLVALAERLAAERYRRWADEAHDPEERAGLLACAAREEEIARRAEALAPDAADVQRAILLANPDLEGTNRTLFAGRPLAEQYAIQARGERLGAATWRTFAERETRADARETYLGCALLEEESAALLESLRGRRP
jgi:hypothetical protein